jgi:hypothetical protein
MPAHNQPVRRKGTLEVTHIWKEHTLKVVTEVAVNHKQKHLKNARDFQEACTRDISCFAFLTQSSKLDCDTLKDLRATLLAANYLF